MNRPESFTAAQRVLLGEGIGQDAGQRSGSGISAAFLAGATRKGHRAGPVREPLRQ
jgi:hypothetical protein